MLPEIWLPNIRKFLVTYLFYTCRFYTIKLKQSRHFCVRKSSNVHQNVGPKKTLQKTKKLLFPEMGVTRKIFTQATANLFFWSIFFCFFWFLFCLFVRSLFVFHPADFRKLIKILWTTDRQSKHFQVCQDYSFLSVIVSFSFYYVSLFVPINKKVESALHLDFSSLSVHCLENSTVLKNALYTYSYQVQVY